MKRFILILIPLVIISFINCPDTTEDAPLPSRYDYFVIDFELINNTDQDVSYDILCVKKSPMLIENTTDIFHPKYYSGLSDFNRLYLTEDTEGIEQGVIDYYYIHKLKFDEYLSGDSKFHSDLKNRSLNSKYTGVVSENTRFIDSLLYWFGFDTLEADWELTSGMIKLNIGGVERNIVGWPEKYYSQTPNVVKYGLFYRFSLDDNYYEEYGRDNLLYIGTDSDLKFLMDLTGDTPYMYKGNLRGSLTVKIKITINSADDISVEVTPIEGGTPVFLYP